MVEQTPFMGESGTFISGSKSAAVSLMNLDTGSVVRLTGLYDNKNSNKDTWLNNTLPPNIPKPEPKGSLMLVINTYKLTAVNLHSQNTVWSVVFSELLDVSDKGDSLLLLSSDHLGYDLSLTDPGTLKATPKSWSKDHWEFKTSAPIIGVYQVIRGARLARLKLRQDPAKVKKSTSKFWLTRFNNTLFAADSFESSTPATDAKNSQLQFEKILLPLIPVKQLLEINDPDSKPHSLSRSWTPLFLTLLSISAIGAATLAFLLCLWLRSSAQSSSATHEIAVGDETESVHSLAKITEKTDENEGQEEVEEKEDVKAPDSTASHEPVSPTEKSPKSIHKKRITGSKVKVGHLSIYTDQILGYGSLGTIVYKGKFEHRSVAVKRMLRPFHDVATKEISALIVSDNHPHVIRYFTKEEDKYADFSPVFFV